MDYFPVFLRLRGQRALVVGGGEVAARKAQMLLRAKARVTAVAPELCDTLHELVRNGALEHRVEAFSSPTLDGARLVIAASDDRALNALVAQLCDRLGIPVNVVDDPGLCSFIVPAVVDRSPLMIAIGSGAKAPVLARYWRARIEALVPAASGRLADLAGRYRRRVKARLKTVRQRLRFWEAAFEGKPAGRALAGDMHGAGSALEELMQRYADGHGVAGEVYLVGAGPGDPDLLTFKALKLMQQADVVLYDRLVAPGVLDLVRRDAERVFVGKCQGRHALPQEELNALMVRLAREGRRVLRLKGGDPFIFGRGGEEIQHLAAEGIGFQVVPGVTAASGCAAYAGIPLTHRDHAQACVFVTGHRSRNGELELNWPCLARPGQTVVFYMALRSLPVICREMRRHGLAGDYPAAVVEQGTLARQRVVVATLSTLADEVARAGVEGPALVIVGEVVTLNVQLGWFGDRASFATTDVDRHRDIMPPSFAQPGDVLRDEVKT